MKRSLAFALLALSLALGCRGPNRPVTEDQVEQPVLSPAGGVYAADIEVEMSCATPGSEIRYTLDESLPSSSHGTLYSTPVAVSLSSVLKAVACRDRWLDSPVVTASYAIDKPAGKVDDPVFFPPAGTYSTRQLVSISTPLYKATMRYTLDGTTPTDSHGQVYVGSIELDGDTVVKAVAFKEGWTNSAVVEAAYVFQTASPTFSPEPGAYSVRQQEVLLDTVTPGAAIRYTLDGSEPTEIHGALYVEPIPKTDVSSTTVIKALAYRTGWASSDVAVGEYTLGKILPLDWRLSGRFAVDLELTADGSRMVAGGPDRCAGGMSSRGIAYVFDRRGAGWAQVAVLEPSGGAANDYFGRDVAISGAGDLSVVGSHCHDQTDVEDQGGVYVFTESGGVWSEAQILLASDGVEGDRLGETVAVSADGGTILVASPQQAGQRGGVYVFTDPGGGWTQTQKLTASDGASGDLFGSAVGISEDGLVIVIGAPGDQSGTGAVYIFTDPGATGTWTEAQKLTGSGGTSGDRFGEAVAVSADGSVIAAGASDRDFATGVVYVFNESGGAWSQDEILTASDGAASDYFGMDLDISSAGGLLVIGAQSDDVGAEINQGSAYVFIDTAGTWTEDRKLLASDGEATDFFGAAVAVSDDESVLVCGAPWDDVETVSGAGSAYWYE